MTDYDEFTRYNTRATLESFSNSIEEMRKLTKEEREEATKQIGERIMFVRNNYEKHLKGNYTYTYLKKRDDFTTRFEKIYFNSRMHLNCCISIKNLVKLQADKDLSSKLELNENEINQIQNLLFEFAEEISVLMKNAFGCERAYYGGDRYGTQAEKINRVYLKNLKYTMDRYFFKNNKISDNSKLKIIMEFCKDEELKNLCKTALDPEKTKE